MAEQILTHVEERDIDLLLVEELRSSATFREWIGAKLFGQPVTVSNPVVLHSTSRTGADWGETDIEFHADFSFASEVFPVTLLIEDKIDSPFTAQQAERYREACQKIIGRKAMSALFCPREYTSTHPLFDITVYHEEISDFFRDRAKSCQNMELAERLVHRADHGLFGHKITSWL